MTIAPPTVLASRRFPGGAPVSVHGNLSWNDDGQVLYIYTRGVKVLVSPDAFAAAASYMSRAGYPHMDCAHAMTLRCGH